MSQFGLSELNWIVSSAWSVDVPEAKRTKTLTLANFVTSSPVPVNVPSVKAVVLLLAEISLRNRVRHGTRPRPKKERRALG